MRLHVLSDLHLECALFTPAPCECDAVILAGDLDEGRAGLDWLTKAFADKPVIYVLGNHEFYRNSVPALVLELQEAARGTNVHVLENSAVELGGYRFLGCTLWTDFQLNGDSIWSMAIAQNCMSDYRCIENSAEGRRLCPADTVALHRRSRAWLRERLGEGDPAKTIVVTHHAPSNRGEPPNHRTSALAPAFASELDRLVEQSRVPLWIYGHTHHSADFRLGGTRVVSNQRGYPDENKTGFDPELVIEI